MRVALRRAGVGWMSLFGALTLVACAGRATSVAPDKQGSAAGANGAAQAGQAQGGAPVVDVPSGAGVGGLVAGGVGGMLTSNGGVATDGGAAPNPVTPVCDAACLDSVASQKSDFGMAWQSSWFLIGCEKRQGHDCVTVPTCPNQGASAFEDKGAITVETFPIGGVKGQHYRVTFTFNALASFKNYTGGTRDQGDVVPANAEAAIWESGFYRDGSSVPSNYDSWKLSVLDEAGKELRHYYMNACPFQEGMNWESHRTFLLSYTKSIIVVGGGKVTHRVQDPNCYSIDNCGPGNVPPGACAPRKLANEPDVPVPAMYQDPADGQLKPTTELSVQNPTLSQPWDSQLGHLTITSVEVTTDPVTKDYL